jgi:hypothetical protein
MLRGVSFPEVIKEMRFKYRQFEFMDQVGRRRHSYMASAVLDVHVVRFGLVDQVGCGCESVDV